MISGRETLNSIENAISEVERSVQRVQDELKEANDKKASLGNKRVQAFKELAAFRVKNALRDEVITESDNLSRQVAALLQARNKTMATIRENLDAAKSGRDKNLKMHEEILNQIGVDEDKLDDIAGQAEQELLKTPEYADFKKEQQALKSTYDHAQEKARQAEEDREVKGAPYRSDVLFMYLWKRKYGTREYFENTTAVIELLDKWVANLINYYGAKTNYAILIKIPEHINDHMERLQKQLEDVDKQIGQIHIAKVKEIAGSDLTGHLAELRKREGIINARLQKSDADISESMAQLNHFSEGKDYSFKKAINLAAETLEHESFEDLYLEARQTEDPEDDRILERLKNIDNELEHLEDSIEDLKEELQRLFSRKQEMTSLSSDFRRKHYDDPGSGFARESNMNTMIGQVLTGALTAAEYWARAQRYQQWRSRPADPFRHSSPLPPFGGDLSGGDHDFDHFDDFDGFHDDFGDDDFMSDGGF